MKKWVFKHKKNKKKVFMLNLLIEALFTGKNKLNNKLRFTYYRELHLLNPRISIQLQKLTHSSISQS